MQTWREEKSPKVRTQGAAEKSLSQPLIIGRHIRHNILLLVVSSPLLGQMLPSRVLSTYIICFLCPSTLLAFVSADTLQSGYKTLFYGVTKYVFSKHKANYELALPGRLSDDKRNRSRWPLIKIYFYRHNLSSCAFSSLAQTAALRVGENVRVSL